MTQAATTSAIERELHIEAPPETVWRYFTEPGRMVQWMGRQAEADPRPGGVLRVDYNGFDRMRGAFVELVPYSRIVFTWGWETLGNQTPPGASRVEVTLTPQSGGTLLRLVHSGLEGLEVEGHAQGWDFFLPLLADSARTGAAAQPAREALAASEEFASQLNASLCDLRYLIEGLDDGAWARVCPGTGWTVGGNAAHALGHLALAHFAAQTASGERGTLADLTADELDALNARSRAENEAATRVDVLARLQSEGQAGVEAVKAIPPDTLGRSQPMAFAGGADLPASAILSGPLLGDLAAHIADIRAALAQR